MRDNNRSGFDPARRRLLAGFAATATTGLVSSCDTNDTATVAPSASTPSTTLPAPQDSGIDHIVVLMMENRSFDHYLGWVPGANGKQAGLNFPASNAANSATFPTSRLTDYQNCANADPDHSYDGGHTQINNGAMNGFLWTQPALASGGTDTFPIGYYGESDLPFFANAVRDWTICDHYFSGILSSTYPNRVYMHAGQTDRNDNSLNISKLPTVWDGIAATGNTGRYYFHDTPFTAIWGAKYLDISRQYSKFAEDVAAGDLASLTYIDPAFLGESSGVSKDDHPLADIRNGQALMNEVYNILRSSPLWEKTLLIINYDEWGGFFDHVVPPFAPVTSQEQQATGNDGRLGIRVPCALIGPRARRGHVESVQFDPNSILNMIAWRFGFAPLGARASSYNLAYALDFQTAPATATTDYNVPMGPFGSSCNLQEILPSGTSTRDLAALERRQAEHLLEWQGLQAMARRYGFAV